jgi:hypothetical protein
VATFALGNAKEALALLHEAASSSHPVAWTSRRAAGAGRLGMRAGRAIVIDDRGEQVTGGVRVAFVLGGVPLFAELTPSGARVDSEAGVWSTEKRESRRALCSVPSDVRWWTFEDGVPCKRSAELLDLAGSGARILLPPGSSLPRRDSSFPVSIGLGDEAVQCLAEVKNELSTERGTELGLSLEPSPDRDRLADLCARMFLPQVKLRREVCERAVCHLFRESGYFGLRAALRPRREWLALDADALSRDLVYLSRSGEAIGHVSITRAYRNTWLGHQIAMHPHHAEGLAARRNLYLGFAALPTLIDGLSTRLIGFYDRERPWHQVFFEHFARSVGSPDLVVVTPWDRYELREPATGLVAADREIEIRDATPEDLGLLTLVAREGLPPLVANALDLTPSSLVAPALHPAYRATPIGRSRRVFVLRERGEVTAFALAELSDRSLSLFNMLNAAHFFGVAGRASRPGRAALVAHVLSYYRRNDVDYPTLIAPHGSFDAAAHPELTLEETMGCIVWSGAALRAYENYVQLRFNWLERGIRFDEATSGSQRGAA